MTDFLQRAFDLGLALALLVALGPLMLVVALVVRFGLGSPVLFRQARPGLNEKPFILNKFRTMRPGEGEDAARLTPLGSFLRRFSLDELPQLFNVLRGDVSFVGPRPLLMEYLPLYSPEQRRRHSVRPGITGWAQVNGRNAVSWEERFRLDVWYVDHRSFALNLKILALTIGKALRGDGISAEGHVTMPKFQGSRA